MTSGIMIVEELSQQQINELKSRVFWGNCKNADFQNLSMLDKDIIQQALFETDITNRIIYKLFKDVYFRASDFEQKQGQEQELGL